MKQQFLSDNKTKQNQIQINKLLNPVGFLMSMVHQFCMNKKVLIEDVKIKLKKCILNKDISLEQPDSFLISGLFIRRGKFSTDSFLVDEGPREFEQQLPLVQVKIELKVRNKSQLYKTSEKPQTKQRKRNIAIEFSSSNNQMDLESDYYFQLENPFQQFQYEKEKQVDNSYLNKNIFKPNFPDTPRSNSKANQIRESMDIHSKLTSNQGSLNNAFAIRVAMRDENTVKKEIKEINLKENEIIYPKGNYVVRIPVVNPLVQSIFTQFPLEIYVYMHSKKPQEYWDHKRTQIYMQKMSF